MNFVGDFLRYLRFTDGIASSDFIGWILAALAGIVAYKLIDNMQTSIERHNMIEAVEDGFSALFDSVIAISAKPGTKIAAEFVNNHMVMVRSVLHDDTPWQLIRTPECDSQLEYMIINNQRYLHIRDDEKYNEWISTQALHEMCLKVRRIEKLFKSGLMKRVDLSDMFREFIPLCTSGRLEYIAAYYDDLDAECIAYIVMQTVVSCYKCNNMANYVHFFIKYYNDHPEIKKYFISGRRLRPIMDRHAVYLFKKITAQAK